MLRLHEWPLEIKRRDVEKINRFDGLKGSRGGSSDAVALERLAKGIS